jgi:hypothetical protein
LLFFLFRTHNSHSPILLAIYTDNNGAALRHLAVLAVMTMSLRARTDASARMLNSGTASRRGKTARWRVAGDGAPPIMLVFKVVVLAKYGWLTALSATAPLLLILDSHY